MDCPIQRIKFDSFIKRSKCAFEIENFEKYEIGQKIISKKLHFPEIGAYWMAQITPNNINNFTYFNIKINYDAAHAAKPKNVHYGLQGKAGSIIIIDSSFKSATSEETCDSITIEQQKLLPALEDGILTVVLEVVIQCTADLTYLQRHKKSMIELLGQYSSLLNDETFSDFTFIVKGTTFKVHKNILASASETMRAMFTNQFRETAARECIVDEIEPNIFYLMLIYIYTGILPVNLGDEDIDLYKAAHYYRVSKLIEICKENMHCRLSTCNALEIYELSSMFEIEDLKIAAWKFMKSHYFNIFYPLKEEPLPLEDIKEIFHLTTETNKFWSKQMVTNHDQEPGMN